LIGPTQTESKRVSGANHTATLDEAMSEITVYTTEPCSLCTAAKALLLSRGLSFEEINLSKDDAGRAALASRTGMMTFPQVLVGDTLVGGFRETQAAVADGHFDELLAS
jgi:glutaredoxin 3